jgi:hypothetical protein
MLNVKRVNNRIVVECKHCGGTTRCEHAVPFERWLTEEGYVERDVEYWLRCARCGDGFTTKVRRKDTDAPFDAGQLQKPICAVCDGRGFIVV